VRLMKLNNFCDHNRNEKEVEMWRSFTTPAVTVWELNILDDVCFLAESDKILKYTSTGTVWFGAICIGSFDIKRVKPGTAEAKETALRYLRNFTAAITERIVCPRCKGKKFVTWGYAYPGAMGSALVPCPECNNPLNLKTEGQ